MNYDRISPWLISGVLAVLMAGLAGWAIGAGAANGESDASAARKDGFREGFALVFPDARSATAGRGFKEGVHRGRTAGAKTGSREGAAIVAGNVGIEQAVDSEKAAEAAASAAQSEIAARQPNCGIVPDAPSWCPTSDELASYKAAVKAAEEAAKEAEKQKQEDQKPGKANGFP